MWRFIVPAFEQDYRIVLYDLAGCGLSDIKPFDFSKYAELEGYARDLIEIVSDNIKGDAIFIGHSVSSMIGLLAEKMQPGLFSKLVLVAPSPCYINDGEYNGGFMREDIEGMLKLLDQNYLGWSSSITPVIVRNEDTLEFTQELFNSFCAMDPVIASHFARVTFLSDRRDDLKAVRQVDTLVIQCGDDAIAPKSVGDFIQREIGDRCTLDVLDVSGHCPHLTAPEQTVASIKNFFSHA